MSADEERVRLIRLKERSVLKREQNSQLIRSVYELACQVAENPDRVPELLGAVDRLDAYSSAFYVENNSALESLIDLGLASEYSTQAVVEVERMITFAKAVANRFRKCQGDAFSVRNGSQHGSVKSVGQVSVVDDFRSHNSRIQNESHSARVFTDSRNLSTPALAVRLPEIPLPSFDGDIYKWLAFRDRFLAMVDQRPNLSNIDKIYYLMGCLKGEALESLRGIPISGHTYKLAWSTLEARFDKPRLVACSLVEVLLNAPISESESLSELKNFITAFDESIAVLESLQIPNLGDFILFSLASRCLPRSCRTMFESQVVGEYPSVSELFVFVKSRITVLERVQGLQVEKSTLSSRELVRSQPEQKGSRHHSKPSPSTLVAVGSTAPATSCLCCNGTHAVTSCPKFESWSFETRSAWARKQRLCFRCLQSGHWATRCRVSVKCSVCLQAHHTLMHREVVGNKVKEVNVENVVQQNVASASSLVGHLQEEAHSVLLGTALVHIHDCGGSLQTVRALVDSASQISAITAACASRLGLHITRWTAPVSGLSGAMVQNVQGVVDCQVQPRFSNDPLFPLKAWVFPTITSVMPRLPVSCSVANRYAHLALADPSFASPAAIDLLLGADVFAQILNGKRVSVGESYPVAFGSVFGWIIIGPMPYSETSSPFSCPVSLTTSIESLMEKFWSIEEPEPAPDDFTSEGQCEVIFQKDCVRSSSGRFTVPLPFQKPVCDEDFRGSRAIAQKRFESLERKLAADHRLRDLYCQFMNEYSSLGHMSRATSPGTYYIPHHAIYRPSDVNPKIRVVFDASARAFTGKSLNDCLLPGPKLQRDVTDVLLLFRTHRFAFTTDICKMYRQILIAPEQRRFQHILWRASPADRLEEYELNTVTYGVNCAPYLAIRVLHSIAERDCAEFPAVRQALLFHTYVDDICIGADSEEAVVRLQSDLITVLHRAGLELKKWSSNTPSVLANVPPEDRACEPLSFEDAEGVKVLGLRWSHIEDVFSYSFSSDSVIETKRGMLSVIARIFDPLGILAPIVFLAKHLMQRVWQAHLSWDEPLPPDLLQEWRQFVRELPGLQQLQVPRFIGTSSGAQGYLCGFCDASERGYAAVVYLRINNVSGGTSISLLGAKTKLAPMDASTIPRLELCAAVLLARWMHRIIETLSTELDLVNMYAWSDSTIVLNWLSVRHETFKVFVSNRIHRIQNLLPSCCWNHVPSSENPADCASRGLSPVELLNYDLYWKGPPTLAAPISEWKPFKPSLAVDQMPELRPTKPTVLVLENEPEWYSRFSSYSHMVRVVARIRRFIFCCRGQRPTELFLTRTELDQAAVILAKSSQRSWLGNLIRELESLLPVSDKVVARLRPFLDGRGLICVGGRLVHSDLSQERKFPILLSKSSHLALLFVRHWHIYTGHSGPRVMTTLIGRQFWILSLRSLIRTVISRCTVCVKLSSVNPQPRMADLPRSRVTEGRPFSRVGIDFAGPFLMRENRLRRTRQYKVYLAVFICFVVKAVHLEMVTDLTTDAFLAALKRFVSRRGLPSDIYTDCGTNFVGAAKQLKILFNAENSKDHLAATVPCIWHFNPPSAPHFGGLWEAAVRSAKRLLVRIMGEHTFTLEEFSTVLCRVESILNSRPLTPTSSDPAEVDCLTPGHFLIGQPLLAVPEAAIPMNNRPLRNRWVLVNQCVQAFWRRWRDEYLQTLQTRQKWSRDKPNVTVGDLVVIKNAQSSPLQWPMARVSEVLPGKDGVVRVVRLRTSDGFLVRPVVKIVKLPTD